MQHPRTLSVTISADSAAQGFQSFFRDDWNHDKGRDGIGPPPMKRGV
jgi:hypothetical protein